MPKQLPSQTTLLRLFNYNEKTGDLIWRRRTDVRLWWNSRYAGTVAGRKNTDGYLLVTFCGEKWRAHRIIWKMVHGYDPIEIDHQDGNTSDNRLEKLRHATTTENRRNSRRRRNGKYPKGVTFDRRDSIFYAGITVDGKRIHLGSFDNPSGAHAAYCQAALKYHGQFARFS